MVLYTHSVNQRIGVVPYSILPLNIVQKMERGKNKVKDLISECKSRNLNCSVSYQSINNISIEIYKGFGKRYQMLFYTDGYIKLKKAIKEVYRYFKTLE